jgi:cytochrome c
MKHSCNAGKSAQARAMIAAASICCSSVILVTAAFAFPGAVSVRAANQGDATRGKNLFDKRCGGCHALDSDKEGPRLRSVYGRRAGSISSFKYSEPMKTAQITWDAASLDRWLIDTESVVPDNNMDFHVPKSDERADIIEYLRMSSGK